MAKRGDIVFAKTYDVYAEDTQVRPGIVTKVWTKDDGDFAKDREILSLTLFGTTGLEHVDMDKGTTDDDGNWVAGGWSENEDGPSKPSNNDDAAVSAAEPVQSTSAPASTFPGSVGDGSPASLSGTSTDTVGDGSDSAPATQGV